MAYQSATRDRIQWMEHCLLTGLRIVQLPLANHVYNV
jgi:hypothetical protein